VSARQAFIQEQLSKQHALQTIEPPKEIVQPINKEKAILIGLLTVSLITIGGLLMKLRREKRR
jgi:hypothetical protein